MCAARTSKIEFSTTVNSAHNHSLSLFHSLARSLASSFPRHIHIDAMRCKFVLVVPICVLDKRSPSLLCFGSALLLLFRIVFMRSRMFSLRSHSVSVLKTECTTLRSNFCDLFFVHVFPLLLVSFLSLVQFRCVIYLCTNQNLTVQYRVFSTLYLDGMQNKGKDVVFL